MLTPMDTVRSLLEPVDAREWSRRAVVLSLATGLSGCAGLVGSPDSPVDSPTASGTPTETVAETDTPTETATPAQDVELDAEDLRIVWKPSLDEVDSPEAFPERHRPSVTAQAGNDATELEELDAFLEGDSGRQEVELNEGENRFSPRTVSDGENTLKVVNPRTEETVAETSVTGEKPDVYPIDFRDADAATQGTPPTQMQSIGTWDTAYSFDTHPFSHDRIWGKRQDWNKDASYSGLIEMLKSDPDRAAKILDGDKFNVVFPNYEGNSHGGWSYGEFRQASTSQKVLAWANAAVQAQQNRILRDESDDRVESNKFSAYNNANAATTERVINEVYNPESDEDLVRTTFINEGGHGTVLAHVDTENTALSSEADTDWFFVETTGNWVDPITADSVRGDRGDYNPALEGYQNSVRNQEVSYDWAKSGANGALRGFVKRYNNPDEGLKSDRISFSDDIHEFVWDEWINRENGSPEPIVDMVEKAADFHLENDDGYVQVFTAEDEEVQYNEEEEVFENVYMAAGDEDLYRMSMDPDTRLTQADVESYMEEVTAA